MKTDFIRLNVLHAICSIAYVVLLFLRETSLVPFFAIVAANIIFSKVILAKGASAQTHKTARRTALQENPPIVWKVLGLSWLFPFFVGLIFYFGVGLDYHFSLLAFLAAACLGLIAANQIILPHMKGTISATFD